MARDRTRALVSTFGGMAGIADVWLRALGVRRADDDSVFRLVIFVNTPSYIDIINIHVFDCDSPIQ